MQVTVVDSVRISRWRERCWDNMLYLGLVGNYWPRSAQVEGLTHSSLNINNKSHSVTCLTIVFVPQFCTGIPNWVQQIAQVGHSVTSRLLRRQKRTSEIKSQCQSRYLDSTHTPTLIHYVDFGLSADTLCEFKAVSPEKLMNRSAVTGCRIC